MVETTARASGLVLTVLAWFGVVHAETARGAPLDYTIVAREGDVIDGYTLSGYFRSVRINENNEVAFASQQVSDNVLFTPTRVLAAPGDTVTDGDDTTTIFAIHLNFGYSRRGEIAFSASPHGGEAIFVDHVAWASASSNLPPISTIDGLTLSGGNGVGAVLTADGSTVAFVGGYVAGDGYTERALFTQDQVLLKPGDVVDGFAVDALAAITPSTISDAGEVALRGRDADCNWAVLRAGPGGASLVATEQTVVAGDQLNGFFHEPAIDASGTYVAFSAGLNGTGRRIIVAGPGGLQEVVRAGDMIGGVEVYPGRVLGVSTSGEVMFEGFTDPNGTQPAGMFTQHRTMALVDDTIDGVPIKAVYGDVGAFSPSGVGVFKVRLDTAATLGTDLEALVITAREVGGLAVPEPGALGLVLAGLAALVCCVRVRRTSTAQ